MLQFTERKHTRSLKYDGLLEHFGREDLLPLWLADMDCRAPQAVQQALQEQIAHGVYGYSSAEQTLSSQNAACSWLSSQHGISGLKSEECQIYTGIMQALAVCIEVLCPKDAAILINQPAYNGFYKTLYASGRKIIENPLAIDSTGYHTIDFALLEKQMHQSNVRLLVFCSPHNPSGRVWHTSELLTLLRLCHKYDCVLLSDEVHFDLVYPGHRHQSILCEEFRTVHDKIVMISAPNKTFNVMGLRSAYLVCRNPHILGKLEAFREKFDIGTINIMGHIALQTCYTEAQSLLWLNALKTHLAQNRQLLFDFLQNEMPGLKHQKPEGTYLYWVDCRNAISADPASLRHFFMEAGLAFGWGDIYHGEGWVRINFSCCRSLLEQALTAWKQASQNNALNLSQSAAPDSQDSCPAIRHTGS